VTATKIDCVNPRSKTQIFTVVKPVGNVIFDTLSFTYDNSVKSVTAYIAEEPSTSCIVPESPIGPNAGSYPVTATCDGTNYTASGSDTANIAKATGSVAFDALSFTYDGNAKPITAHIAEEPATSCTVLQSPIGPAAGDYSVTATCNGTNYTATGSATASIAPRAVTVTAQVSGKVYGATDPTLTYSVTPALVNGDSLTGSLARAAGENAGTYAINQGSLAASGNYTLSFIGADFAITPLAIAVTANAASKVYGAADPTLTYSVNPALVNGDSLTGALARAAGENAGTYAINQGTLAASGNYTLSFTGADFTITPLAITVTANAASKVYGAADPTLAYSVTPALVNGDSLTGALARAAGENAGTYAINQGTLAASGNYTLSFTGADFTITPLAITVAANAASKVYGESDPALTYSVTPALVNGDSLTGTLARAPGENAGTYAINQGTLAASSNYTLSFTGADFTIHKAAQATLTAIANPASVLFGETSALITTGGSGTGTVSYAVTTGGENCEVAGSSATGIGLGTCTITATKAADVNYLVATATVDVNVTPKADLQLSKDANRASALIGDTVVFTLVAANAGPNDVTGARLVDTPPGTLADVEWACVPAASSIPCPAAPNDAGEGAMDVLFDLPANQYLRYDLIGTVAGVIGAQIHNSASLIVPAGVTDPATPNDASASVLIVPMGVFADGFEQENKALTVPGAEAARRQP
jgi:uncharacterized repeat protein (TIGR01451 family)